MRLLDRFNIFKLRQRKADRSYAVCTRGDCNWKQYEADYEPDKVNGGFEKSTRYICLRCGLELSGSAAIPTTKPNYGFLPYLLIVVALVTLQTLLTPNPDCQSAISPITHLRCIITGADSD